MTIMIAIGLYLILSLVWTIVFDIFLDVPLPINILPWIPLIYLGYGIYWVMEKFIKLIGWSK